MTNRTPDEIWGGDMLGRRQDAQYLATFLSNRYLSKPDEAGFVLAVDGEWGFGKSFMIKRWQEELAFQNYPSVFFNAWENDYVGDPLLAFISELDSGLQTFFDEVPIAASAKQAFLDKVKVTWKPVLKALAFAAAKKAVGFGARELQEALENAEGDNGDAGGKGSAPELDDIAPEVQKAIEKALNEHKTTKNAIAGFKKKLETLITVLEDQAGVQLPLFVFVDELDRCRPDYAIELLEGIKHLFGVPGVYFVVATNTVQLGESVKAVYGSGFDGVRYLKRFFDLQYTLPEPDNVNFARSLFAKVQVIDELNFVHGIESLDGFFSDPSLLQNAREILVSIFSTYSYSFGLGLRDQQQVVEMLEAAFIQLKTQKVHIFFLLFLACTYHQNRSAFDRIAKAGISDEKIFETVRTTDRSGKINYYVFSESKMRQIEKSTDLIEIASMYLARREIPNDQYSNLGRTGEFPQVLLREVDSTPVGSMRRPDYWNYFDVIRHAGGFVDRSKPKSP